MRLHRFARAAGTNPCPEFSPYACPAIRAICPLGSHQLFVMTILSLLN